MRRPLRVSAWTCPRTPAPTPGWRSRAPCAACAGMALISRCAKNSRKKPIAIFLDRNILRVAYGGMTIYTAISDPVRREILGLLIEGEQPAGALVALLNLPQPNVSKH